MIQSFRASPMETGIVEAQASIEGAVPRPDTRDATASGAAQRIQIHSMRGVWCGAAL